jgi:hypothetical protein
MINVVCFCGCSYSFAGDAGACPECGETVTFVRASASAKATSEERERLSPPARDPAPHELAA